MPECVDNAKNSLSVLKIVGLNVCGLASKLQNPEFIEFIQENDIICLTETKTDKADVIDIENFHAFCKHRTSLSYRKSGGIVVYVRDIYSKYVTIIENDCDHLLWIRIDNKAFNNFQNHIIIGSVYIPPINSRYASTDIFDEIERETRNFSDSSECLCLIGDFNSRVAMEKDYFEYHDEETLTSIINDNIFRNESCNISNITAYGFTVGRQSKDKTVNHFGKNLLCKHCNIFILNGRGNTDIEGEFTCKNCSVVDYCIANINFIKHVSEMCIHPFSALYSDVHNPIVVTMKLQPILDLNFSQTKTTSMLNKCRNHSEKAKRWNNDEKITYQISVDSKVSKIKSLEYELNTCFKITPDFIDDIVEKANEVLVGSAKEVFGICKSPTLKQFNLKKTMVYKRL